MVKIYRTPPPIKNPGYASVIIIVINATKQTPLHSYTELLSLVAHCFDPLP